MKLVYALLAGAAAQSDSMDHKRRGIGERHADDTDAGEKSEVDSSGAIEGFTADLRAGETYEPSKEDARSYDATTFDMSVTWSSAEDACGYCGSAPMTKLYEEMSAWAETPAGKEFLATPQGRAAVGAASGSACWAREEDNGDFTAALISPTLQSGEGFYTIACATMSEIPQAFEKCQWTPAYKVQALSKTWKERTDASTWRACANKCTEQGESNCNAYGWKDGKCHTGLFNDSDRNDAAHGTAGESYKIGNKLTGGKCTRPSKKQ